MPLNAFVSILVMPSCMVTSNKFDAPKKVSVGIVVITSGIVTVIKPLFLKTPMPKLTSDSGNLIDVNPEVPINALLPNVVTVFGMLMVAKAVELRNAFTPMFVSPVGKFTVFNSVVPLNTSLPIDVNVFDNVIVSMVAKFWKNPVGMTVAAVEVKFTDINPFGKTPVAVALVPPNKYLKN